MLHVKRFLYGTTAKSVFSAPRSVILHLFRNCTTLWPWSSFIVEVSVAGPSLFVEKKWMKTNKQSLIGMLNQITVQIFTRKHVLWSLCSLDFCRVNTFSLQQPCTLLSELSDGTVLADVLCEMWENITTLFSKYSLSPYEWIVLIVLSTSHFYSQYLLFCGVVSSDVPVTLSRIR